MKNNVKKIAVVLCGSGHKDGSEIRESIATLWALSAEGATFQCFAPNKNQTDVINHLTTTPKNEHRNCMEEAARIARGNIKPLSDLKVLDWDGIILPGGFGAAKNLCDFAARGSQAAVLPELESQLRDFYTARKPIGAICIAPAIVGLAFKGSTKLELTVGERSEASQEIEKMGHKHVVCQVHECHVDRDHKIVTTPAYMYDDAPVHKVFEGIRALVKAILK